MEGPWRETFRCASIPFAAAAHGGTARAAARREARPRRGSLRCLSPREDWPTRSSAPSQSPPRTGRRGPARNLHPSAPRCHIGTGIGTVSYGVSSGKPRRFRRTAEAVQPSAHRGCPACGAIFSWPMDDRPKHGVEVHGPLPIRFPSRARGCASTSGGVEPPSESGVSGHAVAVRPLRH